MLDLPNDFKTTIIKKIGKGKKQMRRVLVQSQKICMKKIGILIKD